MSNLERNQEKWVPTACYMCSNACGIRARRAGSLVVEVHLYQCLSCRGGKMKLGQRVT